jgi:hypothetical protein
MIEEKWSGQQDLNLRQVVDFITPDSDDKASPPAEVRVKAGCDSDKAAPRKRGWSASYQARIARELSGHDPTPPIGVGDDPLLARLQAGAR